MPAITAEAETEVRLYNILGFLFPGLGYPDPATQFPSGDGPIDVYCRKVVFETKKPGKLDARRKAYGSSETPQEQAVRYLDALTAQPNMFANAAIGWRAGVTDGKEWFFYDYHRDAPDGTKLTLLNTLRLDTPDDGESLLAYLSAMVNTPGGAPAGICGEVLNINSHRIAKASPPAATPARTPASPRFSRNPAAPIERAGGGVTPFPELRAGAALRRAYPARCFPLAPGSGRPGR